MGKMSTPTDSTAYRFWLTRSVARSMGVSLTDAIANGRIQPQDYSDLVTACQKCPRVHACQNWLAEPTHEKGEGPRFCLLLPALKALAKPH